MAVRQSASGRTRRNHRISRPWIGAGAAILLSAGFLSAAPQNRATPKDELGLIDAWTRSVGMDENKPAEIISYLEPFYMRGVEALANKKLSGASAGGLMFVSVTISEAYEKVGAYPKAAAAYGIFYTLKKALYPENLKAEEAAHLKYLKDRAAGGTGATTSAAPPRASDSLSDQLDRLAKLNSSDDPSQGLPLIDSIKPKIAEASQVVRLRFYGLAGEIYDKLMRFTLADEMLSKALSEAEASKNPDDLLNALMAMGRHYSRTGDYARAEQLLLRAKPIAERQGTFSAGLLATSLVNVYSSTREYAKALQIAEAAYDAARQQAQSPDDLTLVVPRFTLAGVLDEMGEYTRAEKLLLESKSTFEKMGATGTLVEARVLESLGWHYRAAKDYRKSIEYYDKRMQLLMRLLPEDSLQIANARCQMAETFWVAGDSQRAVPLGIQCNDTKEKYLAAVLASGAEDQRRAYVSTLLHETDVTVSVHVQGHKADPRLGRFALDTVLRRKGRVLDAMSDTMVKARESMSSEDRGRLDRLASVRAVLSSAAMGGKDEANQALIEEARKLEAELSKNAEFRLQASPISTESVQKALPEGAALVELISYRPYDFKAKLSESHAPPEYVAYVLTRVGEPKFVVLGKAAAIDAELDAFRQALSKNQDPKAAARKVDALVMQPVRALLGDIRQVFLSPDGALNLIPYAALVDENGKYLVENYSFTYLTTGRDLLRFGNRATPGSQITVFANPDYRSADSGASAGGKRSASLNLGQVQPLPGTAEEARAIARVIPQAKVLSAQDATESAIKAVKSPRVLHVATHGFFVGETSASNGTRSLELEIKEKTHQTLREENPLLRSGLLFSGAATLKGGAGEDGVLTALEASSLDLRGTGLVVLSACQTAVGEVRSGDGVYGLRRALTLAGAESIVMSLWSVDDEGTRELMSQYYRRLEAGQGRSEALRQVQLEMLRNEKWQSPYFWAAFIPAGDPAPMEFPDPDRPPRTPAYSSYERDNDRNPIFNSPSVHWLRVSAGIAQLSLEGTDAVGAESEAGARARLELPVLSALLVQRKSLRLHDRASGQFVYAGDGKSATEWSYDAMLGLQGDEFGLYAGVRYGMGKAQIGDLSNGGSFFPGAMMLKAAGLEVTGWTGNIAGERASTGLVVRYPVGKSLLLDGGWQKSKGRDGESPSTSITHIGLSMAL